MRYTCLYGMIAGELRSILLGRRPDFYWQRSSVAEQGTHKPLVAGSNPAAATIQTRLNNRESFRAPYSYLRLGPPSYHTLYIKPCLANVRPLSPILWLSFRKDLLSLLKCVNSVCIGQKSGRNMVGTITNGIDEYYEMFLSSRRVEGVTDSTLAGYERKYRFISRYIALNTATRQDIERFLLQFKNPGNRHGYFRVLRAYYNWREESFLTTNPMKTMKAPRLPRLILPSLSIEQVRYLIDYVDSIRDKAIIALFTESGLRLTELCGIRSFDIHWDESTVRVMGKGQKEALAPFGALTERYLKLWLSEYKPDGSNIWGINKWGITAMLRRLEIRTGITCNPHTFRRTFACLLRKAGLDTMTIKDLGRWESIEMVQRYTRSITFQDCMRMYKSIIGGIS